MTNVNKQRAEKIGRSDAAAQQSENSYRLAKLLRSGNRELARQMNIKRAKRSR